MSFQFADLGQARSSHTASTDSRPSHQESAREAAGNPGPRVVSGSSQHSEAQGLSVPPSDSHWAPSEPSHPGVQSNASCQTAQYDPQAYQPPTFPSLQPGAMHTGGSPPLIPPMQRSHRSHVVSRYTIPRPPPAFDEYDTFPDPTQDLLQEFDSRDLAWNMARKADAQQAPTTARVRMMEEGRSDVASSCSSPSLTASTSFEASSSGPMLVQDGFHHNLGSAQQHSHTPSFLHPHAHAVAHSSSLPSALPIPSLSTVSNMASNPVTAPSASSTAPSFLPPGSDQQERPSSGAPGLEEPRLQSEVRLEPEVAKPVQGSFDSPTDSNVFRSSPNLLDQEEVDQLATSSPNGLGTATKEKGVPEKPATQTAPYDEVPSEAVGVEKLRSLKEVREDSDDDDDEEEEEAERSSTKRVTKAARDKLLRKFEPAVQVLQKVAEEENFTFDQVVSVFGSQYNFQAPTSNPWNQYNMYFKDFALEEIERICPAGSSKEEVQEYLEDPKSCKLCYEKFKEANPDYREVLSIHYQLSLLGKDTTVAQRQRAFNKYVKQFQTMGRIVHHKSGFEVALVLVGSSANQDERLAALYESPNIAGFLKRIAKAATDDEIMGHAKAQAMMGLSNVVLVGNHEADLDLASAPADSSMTPLERAQMLKEEDVEGLRMSEVDSTLKLLWNHELGLVNLRPNTESHFLWKRLVFILGDAKVMLIGYPHGVAFPNEENSNKALGGVAQRGRRTLLQCLIRKTLKFVRNEENSAPDRTLVITGEAPRFHHEESRGLRVFVTKPDKRIIFDYRGLPKLPKPQDMYEVSTPVATSKLPSTPGRLLIGPLDPSETPKPSIRQAKRKSRDDSESESGSESEGALILPRSPGSPSPTCKKRRIIAPPRAQSPPIRRSRKPNTAASPSSDYVPTPKAKPAKPAPAKNPVSQPEEVPRTTRSSTRQEQNGKQPEKKQAEKRQPVPDVGLPKLKRLQTHSLASDRPKTAKGLPAPRPKKTAQATPQWPSVTRRKALPSDQVEVIELTGSSSPDEKTPDGGIAGRGSLLRAPSSPLPDIFTAKSPARPSAGPSTRSPARPSAGPSTRSPARPSAGSSARSSSRPSVGPSAESSAPPSVAPPFESRARPSVLSNAVPAQDPLSSHNREQSSLSAGQAHASPLVHSAAPAPGLSNQSQAGSFSFAVPAAYEGASHAPHMGSSNTGQSAPFSTPVLPFAPGSHLPDAGLNLGFNSQMQMLMQDPAFARQATMAMLMRMGSGNFPFNNPAALQPQVPQQYNHYPQVSQQHTTQQQMGPSQALPSGPMFGNTNGQLQGPTQGDPITGDNWNYGQHGSMYSPFGVHPNNGRGGSGPSGGL